MSAAPAHETPPSRRYRVLLVAALAVALLASAMPPALSAQGETERVSVDGAGGDAGSHSENPAVSADGRYVVFESVASDLVAGDANLAPDIFVRDRQTGDTERVSVDTAGGDPNGPSFSPSISADGRYVAFGSLASDLVAGDANSVSDVFVHDRESGATERISVDSTGADSNGQSGVPEISADGRYVAFNSAADDLVAGDANSQTDVFIRDRESGATERVSVDGAGADANAASINPAVSADGRYVAFTSAASDLVAGDANSETDVFLRDRQSGTTERVSVDDAGAEANGASVNCAVSADGRYVAFESDASDLVPADANSLTDVFVHDRDSGTTERVSVDMEGGDPNAVSGRPALSADGRYVAFDSFATDLVPGDANATFDIFVRDRQSGTSHRISRTPTGGRPNDDSLDPALSANGRWVAFASDASDLVAADGNSARDVFVHDFRGPGADLALSQSDVPDPVIVGSELTYTLEVENNGPDHASGVEVALALDDDVDFVSASSVCAHDSGVVTCTLGAMSSGAAHTVQIVVRPTAPGTVESAASVSTPSYDGDPANDSASEETTVHRAPTAKGDTERVSLDTAGADPDDASHDPAVSADGRWVAFASEASDLVAGDGNATTDVFVFDRLTGATERVSVDTGGGDSDGFSSAPAVSADGRFVAFRSGASDLVPGDVNSRIDVFVRDRQLGTTERVSLDSTGADPDAGSANPSISADGRLVAFESDATDLVAGDVNSSTDVFVRDRELDATERVSDEAGGADPGDSSGAAISADGRHVAFHSAASDLVENDDNGFIDVFVHDRQSGDTERVSVDTTGADPDSASFDPSISADGRYVAFPSSAGDLVADDTNSTADVFIRDRNAGATVRASPDSGLTNPDGQSFGAAISAGGRYVAFQSFATNLVTGDSNAFTDVFVYDREAGTTDRVSIDTDGDDPDSPSSGAAISADGRYVTFHSAATDLVGDDENSLGDVFVHDLLGPPELLLAPAGHSFGARALADGPTAPFNFTVSNVGAGTLNIASIELGGVDADQFEILPSGTCGPTLAGGESCDVNVAFDPTTAGAATATLDVVSDGGEESASLSGQGLAPVAALSPATRDFGSLRTDEGPSGPLSFVLSNTGAATLHITAIALEGAGAGQFAIASDTCADTLAPGASCEIAVVFDPSAAGAASALLSVHSDGGSVSGSLAGSGTPPPVSPPSPTPRPDPGPTAQPTPNPTRQPKLAPPRCSGRIATITASRKGATIRGTAGRDVIVGTSGADVIRGGGGRDLICGRGGDDRLLGGDAGDDLHGDAGDDRLAGDAGADSLHGDAGGDVLSGGGASDELQGGGGRDRLDGGAGSDTLRGQGGADRCREGRGPQRTC